MIRKRLPASFILCGAVSLFAQVVGPNINMLTGDQLGSGDPFLQRQNEPSIAVSSRNPAHLMAVANDYRMVDVPGLLDNSDEIGDVWLGIFRSLDQGQSWKSTVLPGCTYNVAPCKLDPRSPINGRMAAADGTIRPGPNGMFVMNGISFDRGKNATSDIFVSRFIDLNNKENGNPIAYLDTMTIDTGTAGVFLDKPWIATALVPGTTKTCTVGGSNGVPVQSFPAFDVYLVYSKFTGSSTKPSSQILFMKSEDCGKTWPKTPIKLSESSAYNQGTSISVNPLNGDIHVAWRRSASSSDLDAIMVTKWTRASNSWVQPAKEAMTFPAGTLFDQPKITGSALSFRAKAFPTSAVDQYGRFYVAWAQRGLAPAPYTSNSRIVVAMSVDGLNFPLNQQKVADPYAGGGHQLMPSLSFAGGRLMLVYYDNRDSQTYGKFTALGGGLYSETRVPVLADRDKAFAGPNGQYVVDNRTLPHLHTIDVRGVQAIPAPANAVDKNPQFGASTRISQYKIGKLPSSYQSQFPDGATPDVAIQLEYNPPNFPMFARGSASFMGDYIEVAAPVYLPKVGGGWEYNLTNPDNAVFHATWADNRNVRPPSKPLTWQDYTPVGSVGGTSSFDQTQSRPLCKPGQEGMRNQDIYTARISGGLILTTAGNDKPLSGLKRAYSVIVQNQTRQQKTFRLEIANQPAPSGSASFLYSSAQPTLLVTVAARGSAARTVFIESPNANATVKINVLEVNSVANPVPTTGGLQSSAILNPDIVNPDIVNPDIVNPDIVNPDIVIAESYNPDIANPDIVNPDIVNPDIVNPDIANPDIANPDIVNPDIVNPDIVNPDIVNPDIANPDIVNPDIANPDIAAGYSDTIYTIKNIGNTSSSYLTKLYSRGGVNVCQPGQVSTAASPCVKMQLFLSKQYKTNIAGVQANSCKLSFQVQNQIIATINTPVFTPLNSLPDTNSVTNPAVNNPSIALAPGEQAQVVLRTFGNFNPRDIITPVVVAEAPKGPTAKAPVTLTITNGSLPDALRGRTYSAAINTIGSVLAEIPNSTLAPTFSIISGSLPPGLSIVPDPSDRASALIQGTLPDAVAGTVYSFRVDVREDPPLDAYGVNLPLRSATQQFSIRIVNPLVQPPLSVTPLPPAALNENYSADFSVEGGTTPLTFNLAPGSTLPTGLTLTTVLPNTAHLGGVPTVPGTFTFVLEVRDASCIGTPCAPQLITVTLSIGVDGTAPVVSATLTGTLGANGWYTSSVGVVWSVEDPESGVRSKSADCVDAAYTSSVNLSCAATNGVGMTATVTKNIRIDATAPVVTPSVVGTQSGGWYTSAVTVSWSATDDGSGLQTAICAPTTLTADTAAIEVSCTATNNAGLSTTARVTIRIDRTGPQITITTPADGASFNLGATFVASYTCVDALSGVASCRGTSDNGTSVTVASAGAGTLTVTATDLAGNTSTLTNTYTVNQPLYTFTGFGSPLSAAGTFAGRQNLGGAVPIKYSLADSNNVPISDLATTVDITSYFTGPRVGNNPCPVVATGTPFVLYHPTVGGTGNTQFRVSSGQYTFNWDTATAQTTGPGCYTLSVTLKDGSAARLTSLELR